MVVGHILPDEEMPYLEDGRKVDVIVNALGVVNRLNPLQLFEMSTNFITVEVSKKLATFKSLKDKESLLFDIIGRFNKRQLKELKEYYKSLSTSEKKEFFKDIEDTQTIYINQPPTSREGDRPLFDIIRDIYKDYDWIKPSPVYINKFGRKIRIMKDLIVGEVYFMKLKQSSKKGFSARSTGSISKKDVPEKSYRTKEHQDVYSTTPIRIGVDENNNSSIAVDPSVIANLHLYYRSSPVGRRKLGDKLSKNMKVLKKVKKSNLVTNRNAEILNAYLMALGVQIAFPEDKFVINPDVGGVKTFETEEGGLLIGTNNDYKDYTIRHEGDEYFKYYGSFVGSKEEYKKRYDEEIEKRKKK